MKALDKARFILYRMHDKGVEIFLVNTNISEHGDLWKFPVTNAHSNSTDICNCIELKMKESSGEDVEVIAMEGDWHDIPRIREILKHDVHMVTSKLKDITDELDQGSFFTLKEAFKRVLPSEYKMLKELKDIIFEKNQVKYI